MRKEESGRSLVEIIGVLAIGAIMIAAAYAIYKSLDNRQTRLIATETLKDVAKKTKTLYEFSGYNNVSVEQLVSDGALSSLDTPIGTSWSITGTDNGTKFKITINGLTEDDCNYFLVKKSSDWAESVSANTNNTCTTSNTVVFTVK